MEVIQFVDPTGQTLVARVPRQGTATIEPGSELIVEESQQAVFLGDDRALDAFGPGRHTLATSNLPFLTRALGLASGGDSPFQAAVVFASLKTFSDLKWGTREPVIYRDPELAAVRLRAFGKLAVRIGDPRQLVNQLVGARGITTTDGLEGFFRETIVGRLSEAVDASLSSIFDLGSVAAPLAEGLKARVADDFARVGIELVDLLVLGLKAPQEVQKRIDERSGASAGPVAAVPPPGGETPPTGTSPIADRGPGSAPASVGSPPVAGGPGAAGQVTFCHQCGHQLPAEARFCPTCGAKVALR